MQHDATITTGRGVPASTAATIPATVPADPAAPASSVPGGVGSMIRALAWDLGLPVATYYALHAAGVGDTAALFAGTVAAGLRLATVAVRDRTLSAFSLVIGAMFGVGLVFTLVTGDPRMMLVKHSVTTAILGLAFLASTMRGRPLTLAAQQSFLPAKAAELAELYATSSRFQRGHRVSSIVWGAGLLAEAAVRLVLIYVLPVSVMVGLSTVLTVVTITGLIAWNARYQAAQKRAAHVLAA
ncbi:VC0807 family protein [Actinoplanes rectilineatus]|uniref:VC0807 family protein n=1 Tax=Actinoplanes rectilineatus TaxID=113571 RepID=UPI000AF504CF|nr:VC0807 family protein [Actinoplanes rectilineatus]